MFLVLIRAIHHWDDEVTIREAHTRKSKREWKQDRIERLEDVGFQWRGADYDEAFEKRCRELIASKEKFGHCNVLVVVRASVASKYHVYE